MGIVLEVFNEIGLAEATDKSDFDTKSFFFLS